MTYRDTPSNAPYSKVSTGRRLALARWIVDRRNPLTARVAVNHVWARHFGEPLVASTYDFGLRTPRPEHHRSARLAGCRIHGIGLELQASAQADRHARGPIGCDHPNRVPMTRMSRSTPTIVTCGGCNLKRMEGEVVRDSVLFLAGRLDPKIGGPEQPVAVAETGTRRTIYYRYASGDNIPLLTMFDAANVTECYRRHETIVPQQALAMINSGMVLTPRRRDRGVIDREVGSDPSPSCRAAFVDAAFERILGRAPTEAERSECLAGLVRLVRRSRRRGRRPRTPGNRGRSAWFTYCSTTTILSRSDEMK